MDGQAYDQELEKLEGRFERIEDHSDAAAVAVTAEQLERLHYDVGIEPRGGGSFLRMSKDEVRSEIGRIKALKPRDVPDEEAARLEKVKLERISLIVYHYELLARLRAEDAAAWDTVEDLYGED